MSHEENPKAHAAYLYYVRLAQQAKILETELAFVTAAEEEAYEDYRWAIKEMYNGSREEGNQS